MSNRIPNFIYMFLIKLNKTKRFLHSKCISSTKMYFIVSKYVNCRRLTVYRIKKIHLNIDLQFGKKCYNFRDFLLFIPALLNLCQLHYKYSELIYDMNVYQNSSDFIYIANTHI